MKFKSGLKDGFPIALGYVSVSFAYAAQALSQGFPPWFPMLVSFTNFTGTGQFAGTNLIAQGANFAVLFATMLIINIRYTLMSFALAQKMGSGFPLWQRAAIAFGMTDENFAVAVRQTKKLSFPYLMGLMGCSFSGWLVGTALGAGIGQILSSALTGNGGQAYYDMIMSALGIALYAMFVAIILPQTRDDSHVFILVLATTALSCVFYFVPFLKKLPAGLEIIICSVICTAVIAYFFPHDDRENSTSATPPEPNNTNQSDSELGGVQ